jgi:hypothetical protein
MIEENPLLFKKSIRSLNNGQPDFPINPRESSIKMTVFDGFLD